MAKRVRNESVEVAVLLKSKRKCCVCFFLNNDLQEKEGQLAHLDGDRSNTTEENFAFLCLAHHSLLDTKASQHKGLSIAEVKQHREKLYAFLAEEEKKARSANLIEKSEWSLKRNSSIGKSPRSGVPATLPTSNIKRGKRRCTVSAGWNRRMAVRRGRSMVEGIRQLVARVF